VLGGGFYSTRLSIDLRKNAGLVYSVGAALQAGRTRSFYSVQYASDPQNVIEAANIVAREIKAMQTTLPTQDELVRVKSLLVRQIPLSEAGVDEEISTAKSVPSPRPPLRRRTPSRWQ
jgi:zinc protease